MKFNFKIQQYQTDAVNAVVKVFEGQGTATSSVYRRDLGVCPSKRDKTVDASGQGYFSIYDEVAKRQAAAKLVAEGNTEYDADPADDTGYKNNDLRLSNDELLEHIHAVQTSENITLSPGLVSNLGRCSLDVEMETGTGKTYVYIKTMFELNKHYGWSKFIVVVPSIAIREGVKKSFEMTTDHFMEQYGKKARFFIYNSSNLNQLDGFSQNSGINVMIINTQAFAASLKEGGRSKESRIIYSKRDEFGSRRPIDVVAANHPIIIMDEPQKMGGAVTQNALQNFHPLFCLNYSATHREHHNLIYVLDALDAFKKRLVKKIQVKGFQVKNLLGTNKYLYLQEIVLSQTRPPMARLELEVKHNSGIKREMRLVGVKDNLYYKSNEMEQYKGYVVSMIDPITGKVTFTNGEELETGMAVGNVSEKDIRRIQIRETIASHFEKEEKLFRKGIKTLSLFFIDEVANYRKYDEDGNEELGEYGKIFEEEYQDFYNQHHELLDSDYQSYLETVGADPHAVHKGYFSIDKRGRSVNSDVKRGSDVSDDISAYDLILKNKERLLSFEEPTRFIFSHSALREGWDNPNVFQICTLKHSDSETGKRQEVGRGLRLCVNQDGNRMDQQVLGDRVHDINMLTVIASDSYEQFVSALQDDFKAAMYKRPKTITQKELVKMSLKNADGSSVKIDDEMAQAILFYGIKNDYLDKQGKVTDTYRHAVSTDTLVPLPEELRPMTESIHNLIQSTYSEDALKEMISNGHETKVKDNPLNDNFKKKEFQDLWKRINHKYAYKVEFDSDELIRKSIDHINKKLFVSELMYTTTIGEQKADVSQYDMEQGESFDKQATSTKKLPRAMSSTVAYDLVGDIAKGTVLTRRTVVAILKGIDDKKLYLYQTNPEEFISKVIRLIKEQKSTMIVEHISYNIIDGEYDSTIFTAERPAQSFNKAYQAEKAIQDYVFTDGQADESVEKKFAKDLDTASEVCVYAKLPRGFQIPTPMGNYSPDWAIAFHKGTVKHVFFIAETKGTMSSMELRPIEQAKISCAKKLFESMSDCDVKYHDVDSFETLMNVINSL